MTIRALLERAEREEYITAIEAAAILRFDPQTVWRKIRRNEIPGVVRLGRSIRIRKAVMLAWQRQRQSLTGVDASIQK